LTAYLLLGRDYVRYAGQSEAASTADAALVTVRMEGEDCFDAGPTFAMRMMLAASFPNPVNHSVARKHTTTTVASRAGKSG
jgi:hypothetical protein